MSAIIEGRCYLYGVLQPPPQLPGYEISMKTGHFLLARKDGLDWFVEQAAGGYRLTPKIGGTLRPEQAVEVKA